MPGGTPCVSSGAGFATTRQWLSSKRIVSASGTMGSGKGACSVNALWHGLLTVPPDRPQVSTEYRETFGRRSGTVRRPCHNGEARARNDDSETVGSRVLPIQQVGVAADLVDLALEVFERL